MDKESTRRMHQTFSVAMDAPGDTQVDPEIFKEFTSGLLGSNSMIGVVPEPLSSAAEEGSSESARDFAVVSSQEQRNGAIASPVTVNDDPETQYRAQYAETSPLKLLQTPSAYTNRQQDSESLALSSVAKSNETPGTVLSASAFFGFNDTAEISGMSLTQAFNATQAKTSPAVGHLSEDVVFQRPSPNFAHARHSSPGAVISSPIKVNNRRGFVSDPIMRSSSEPRADYESMKHSQERRTRDRMNTEAGFLERQDSWEEPAGIEKFITRQKAKEQLAREAAKSLAAVSAPTTPGRRVRKRDLLSLRETTTSPMKPTKPEQTLYHGSYDGASAETPRDVSEPPPRVDNDDKGDEDEDLPDELSHEDPFNQRPALTTSPKEGRHEQRVLVPHTSSYPPHAVAGHSSRSHSQREVSPPPLLESQLRGSASQPAPKGLSRLRSSKETDVVMDSQPDSTQPAPLRYPSSPSVSHYSINQTTMLPRSNLISSPMSSMVPMPPRTSSPELGQAMHGVESNDGEEDRVPSSPPLVAPDDDITYDEHAYEEHSDDDQEGAIDDRAPGDDVAMADVENEDDLPASQNGCTKDIASNFEDQEEADQRSGSLQKSDEVPETVEPQQDPRVSTSHSHGEDDDEAKNQASCPIHTDPQSTIPEADMLEETQPSFFPEDDDDAQPDAPRGDFTGISKDFSYLSHAEKYQLNGHEHSDTTNEQPTNSLSDKDEVNITDNTGIEPAPITTEGTSLLEIANLPDTQRSVDLNDLDLPQLSVDENHEDYLDAMVNRESHYHPQKKRRTTYSSKQATRSSFMKMDPLTDVLTNSSPRHDASYIPGWSPPTTQNRDAHGAQAAARALNEARIAQPAMLKSQSRFKPAQPQTPRKGALKTINKSLLSKSPGKTPETSSKDVVAEPTTPSRSTGIDNIDVEMREMVGVDDSEQIQDPNALENAVDVITVSEDFVGNPLGDCVLPNRVFAFWPGVNCYYPATCLGRVDSHRLKIRYDDGNETILEGIQVRALDLRVEDHVKVDIPGMKKMAYTVVGFKDKVNIDDLALEFPATTRHGYSMAVLEEKRRESLPAAAAAEPKKRIDIPIIHIYLTSQLWARMKDRAFQFKSGSSSHGPSSQIGTPKAVEAPIPISTSLRRSTAGPSFLRDSAVRASSVASSTRSSGNVFANMAFAITSTSDTVNKDGLGKLITSKGGVLVDEGFHELFDTDSYDAPASSAGSGHTSSSLHGLTLKPKNEKLRFVALIAQSHSRSPKFIQALSLNIPCLHLKWVHDSVAAGHALPFAKYLLPAGVSTFLDPAGVVRSRDMPTFDPTDEDSSFAQMILNRDLIFRDQSILIVTEENAQEPYIFLTRAMGATEVGQCNDLDEAKDSFESGAWDWVYVDVKPGDLANAASFIFGRGNAKARKNASKKRKRESDGKAEALIRSGVVGGETVRVVCGEFVIQSLILGALIEE